jgi:hypothetical protein
MSLPWSSTTRPLRVPIGSNTPSERQPIGCLPLDVAMRSAWAPDDGDAERLCERVRAKRGAPRGGGGKDEEDTSHGAAQKQRAHQAKPLQFW